MKEFLRKVPLFSDMPDSDLESLANITVAVDIQAGEILFSEGDAGDSAYVIEKGQLEITKQSEKGGEDVLLAVVGPGDVIGEMALLDEAPRMASAIAKTDVRLLSISQEQLDELLNSSPSATRALLYTITNRWRETEGLLMQSEKMAQLGTLTAGMAHELNNPASAVRRGAAQINEMYSIFEEIHYSINRTNPSRAQIDEMFILDEQAKKYANNPIKINSLDRSDREYTLETILEKHNIGNAWEVAPALVNLDADEKYIDEMVQNYSPSGLEKTLEWLGSTYNIYSLLEEISQAARHISNVVVALKTYAYQESTPQQNINIQTSLEETFLLMENVIPARISITKVFDPDLPTIQGYQSELGQVWANILKNAIDAIEGEGNVIVRIKHVSGTIVVKFEDDGAGIPEDIQSKIFDPFFTTKAPGEGVGLGLSISYNIIKQKHGGEITVVSEPGKTIFSVTLPVKLAEEDGTKTPTEAIKRSGDKTITNLFSSINNIAVVGISSRENRPANFVPAYLKKHGYTIFPINPSLETVLGQKAYPSLQSVPEPIDVVEIFRRSEEVPQIVDDAIEVGAKIIWMQEGIINEPAAAKARAAGITVIMDSCMRKQHMRLVKDEGE